MHDAVAKAVERVLRERPHLSYMAFGRIIYYLLTDLATAGPWREYLDGELTTDEWVEQLEFALALSGDEDYVKAHQFVKEWLAANRGLDGTDWRPPWMTV